MWFVIFALAASVALGAAWTAWKSITRSKDK